MSQVWHHSPRSAEVLFYFWSASRLLSEAAEFGGDDEPFTTHLRVYLSDPWNALDALFNSLIVALLSLRLYTSNLQEEHVVPGEDHWVAVVGSNLFAVMIVLCWLRSLQFFGYFQSLGVLQVHRRAPLPPLLHLSVLRWVCAATPHVSVSYATRMRLLDAP